MSVAALPARSKWPRSFEFLLVPDFSMMPFTAAIEALRVANSMEGEAIYRWTTLSARGEPVLASNGTSIQVDGALSAGGAADALVVCAGINAYRHRDRQVAAQLRRISRQDCLIGSVCSGSIILADAGLLDGRRCTGHWEDLETLIENYPALEVTGGIFEIDGNRFTCSGGTAPLDLMIHFISNDFGRDLAVQVADQMLHQSARAANQPQRLTLADRTGTQHPRLLAVLGQMEGNIENPLPLADLARNAGLSLRQLERLFARQLGTRPMRYYRDLRLQRARQLVQQTGLSMLEIAVATGFTTPTHFARAYGEQFGHPPSLDRTTALRRT